jgi:predicted transporter
VSKFTEFNNKLGVRITKAVGSMGAAYLFAVIALISLPAAIASHNVIVIVSWVAQTFLQLVLLSIIMVGQGVQTQQSEERMEKMMKHMSSEIDRLLDK